MKKVLSFLFAFALLICVSAFMQSCVPAKSPEKPDAAVTGRAASASEKADLPESEKQATAGTEGPSEEPGIDEGEPEENELPIH